MTNTATAPATHISHDPNRPMADHIGEPQRYITWEGVALDGAVELDRNGRPIVRFADGRWAFATVRYVD